MNKDSFTFKQFTVYQDRCAMKVCSDSCIFGAMIPAIASGRVLDIGTGTGLLALMTAQKTPAHVEIDCVELDTAAGEQAAENFELSPWAERLNMYATDIREFTPPETEGYELIISNPPFFDAGPASPDVQKALAKHDAGLNTTELAQAVNRLLKSDGILMIIMPPATFEQLETKLKESGIYLQESTLIHYSPQKKAVRTVGRFNRYPASADSKHFYTHTAGGNLSDEWKKLVKDYYLGL